MIDQRIGAHFWASEFLRSDIAVRKGLDNIPHATEMANIMNILGPGMQRVRDTLGTPVMITSGYRSPEVNAAVGGSRASQHTQGLAADFISPAFGTSRAVCKYLLERSSEIRFDQLIYEGSWVHISFPLPGKQPRNEVLTAHFMGGQASYSRGLV
jgi:zinc D-Ala-D-Ala carboxypeptidase